MPLIERDLFESLQAEREGDWLPDVYIPPANPLLTGRRSYVLYGARGSGKSALATYLKRLAAQQEAMVVEWRPPRLSLEQAPSQGTLHTLGHLLGIFAEAIFRETAIRPSRFEQAPKWTQKLMLWFLKSYIPDWSYALSRISDDQEVEGQVLLENMETMEVPSLFHGEVAPEELLRELARALKTMGATQIWFLVDGLESWLAVDPDSLARALQSLFSALVFFEDPRYLWRFMLPLSLEVTLRTSGALARRRLDVYHLTWEHSQLQQIVEARLAAQFDRADFTLSDLTEATELVEWLKLYGGDTPQGWLALLSPIVTFYRQSESVRPISKAEWSRARGTLAPRLRMDLERERIIIGRGVVGDLQESELRILRYLYLSPTRTATRRQLYFQAYRNLPHEPLSVGDEGWEGEATWGPVMDTALWRIRKALEPARGRSAPIYLLSQRGKGTVALDRLA